MALISAAANAFRRKASFNDRESIQQIGAFLRYLVPEEYRARAAAVVAHEIEGVFQPISLVVCGAMTELVLQHCPKDSGVVFQHPSECKDFSLIILSFQDNLAQLSRDEIADPKRISTSTFRTLSRNQIGASSGIGREHAFGRLTALAHEPGYAAILAERLGQKTIGDWFAAATSITIDDYQLLLLVFLFTGIPWRRHG